MSVIRTKQNFVYAYDPQPEDAFVYTWLMGSEKRHLLTTRTIDQYQAAVDWAVGMADQMAHPIEVVTVSGAEYLKRNRDALEGHLASLTDQERGELRQHMVASMTEIMRDCPDDDTRAGAYEVLQKLKVI
jgi:hypothetical protein